MNTNAKNRLIRVHITDKTPTSFKAHTSYCQIQQPILYTSILSNVGY